MQATHSTPLSSPISSCEHAHPLRARSASPQYPAVVRFFNAAFFGAMDWYTHWKYAARKQALFADLPDTVVEIGPGTGANLRYLRRGSRVIAVEPNDFMHAPLRRTAQKHGISLEVRATGAERIDLPDASVDAVIASLVLCSVGDQRAVLTEIQRILRPSGRFICLEHVAADASTVVGAIQRAVLRPWQFCFEGCHTHRDTESALRSAGFAQVAIERFTLPTAFVPIRPQIAAICTR